MPPRTNRLNIGKRIIMFATLKTNIIMKTKIFLILTLLCLTSLKIFAQTPFTTLVKEPRFLVKKVNIDNMEKFVAVTDTSSIKFKEGKIVTGTSTVDPIQESTKNNIDFFKNNGLTLNLVNKGENRLSVNSQVLHYKLYVANPNEKNKSRLNRYNIPLLVITKLSSNYDSISASSSLDVLDYEAAPITLRLMPSFKTSFQKLNDVFYYGFYLDARVLNLQNPTDNSYEQEIIGAGGIGLTYQGDGQAGTYNSNGEYAPGRYSISVILQGATGKKDVITSLFDTKNGYVFSLQSYLLFYVSESSPLNLKIGYQYFFQETIAGTKHNFAITIGI